MANGASYPDLIVTVSVASSASASVTNAVSAKGGGEAKTSNDSANDPTAVTQVADLTVGSSHTGSFQQGDGADNYTITVSNSGPGPTTGQVTVVDTLPAGLPPTAASGTGWTTSISGQTVTATRTDALASGASYPGLTITVSVATDAPASVANTATVSGGGELNTTNDGANDPTTVLAGHRQSLGLRIYRPEQRRAPDDSSRRPHLAIPGMVVSLFMQDSQGNWTEVAGKSPTKTGQDGAYHFDKLLVGKYRIQMTPSPNLLDGKATVGAIGGAARGTAGQDQIMVQLGPGESGTEYNFGERGLRAGLISRRLFLASTPPLTQIIDTLLSQPVTAAPHLPAQRTSLRRCSQAERRPDMRLPQTNR